MPLLFDSIYMLMKKKKEIWENHVKSGKKKFFFNDFVRKNSMKVREFFFKKLSESSRQIIKKTKLQLRIFLLLGESSFTKLKFTFAICEVRAPHL